VVVPVSGGSIASIIRAAAARYGVDGDRLVRVAMCESGLNPNASNLSGAEGLFQFKSATFYGHGGHNIWDPADQSDVAARMFAQGMASQWTCR
jgi:soluble lytic murein transglycosylase-like protein